MGLTYVALHEVTWCMVVWCTQDAPRRQQFYVAPAMSALQVQNFGGYSKTRYKKLVAHMESHANAVSLPESREQCYIKATNNKNNRNNNKNNTLDHPVRSHVFLILALSVSIILHPLAVLLWSIECFDFSVLLFKELCFIVIY